MQPTLTNRFHSKSAFTLIELLVVIAIILVLAGLSIGPISQNIVRGQMVDTMNNARNIHRATFQMDIDSMTSGVQQGWPGDGTTFQVFVDQLVDGGYLDQTNVRRALRAPEVIPDPAEWPPDVSALYIYGLSSNDRDDKIFISTQNWNASAPAALDPNALPYGDKGFVIIRKGGDAQQLQATFAENDDILPSGGNDGAPTAQTEDDIGSPPAGGSTE